MTSSVRLARGFPTTWPSSWRSRQLAFCRFSEESENMGEETWVSYTTEFPDWDELSKRMLPLIAAALDAEWTMEPVERFNAVVDKSKLEFVLTPIKYWRFHMRPKVAPPPAPEPEPTPRG